MKSTQTRIITEQSPVYQLPGLYPARVVRGKDMQGWFTCLAVRKPGRKGIRNYVVNVNRYPTPIEAIKDFHRRVGVFM